MSTLELGEAECGLCPRHCRLKVGQRGVCRARWNVGGHVVPVAPNQVCSLGVDPIEKKPLYHVVPGSSILSVACAGCTLQCRHCQNAAISQADSESVPSRELSPNALATEMRRCGCSWVAYTYTEPFAWHEYALACCQKVTECGGRNALVTGAYAEEAPVRVIRPWVAAANVDLKAMSESFYRDVCGGSLGPVLRALELFRDGGVHLEITNLLIPTLNDGEKDILTLAEWVRANLGSETPLHFSRFVPRHRLADLPPTPVETLLRAREIARSIGLKHVYLGNVDVAGGSDTSCPQCGMTLVSRSAYHVRSQRVTSDGHCPVCAASIMGIWS